MHPGAPRSLPEPIRFGVHPGRMVVSPPARNVEGLLPTHTPSPDELREGGAGLAEQIEEAFDRADADGDGRLDRAEAERFLALMGNRLGDDAAATEEAGADDWADEDNVEVEELIGKFPAAALRAAAEDAE